METCYKCKSELKDKFKRTFLGFKYNKCNNCNTTNYKPLWGIIFRIYMIILAFFILLYGYVFITYTIVLLNYLITFDKEVFNMLYDDYWNIMIPSITSLIFNWFIISIIIYALLKNRKINKLNNN